MKNEIITKWQSRKHPENPNFMQVVKYLHVQYPDGRNNLHWALANASANDKHLISNISLEKAQELYTDKPVVEITEDMFQEWLKNKSI